MIVSHLNVTFRELKRYFVAGLSWHIVLDERVDATRCITINFGDV
jgi:hypothetical protein